MQEEMLDISKRQTSRSRGSSKRSREVNERQTQEYLKRPAKRMDNPNKALQKAYKKKEYLKDSKFDYIRLLNNKRTKKEEDSFSEHGGTDDQEFTLDDKFKSKKQRKMNIQSDSEQPKRSKGIKRGKKGTKLNLSLPRPQLKQQEQKQIQAPPISSPVVIEKEKVQSPQVQKESSVLLSPPDSEMDKHGQKKDEKSEVEAFSSKKSEISSLESKKSKVSKISSEPPQDPTLEINNKNGKVIENKDNNRQNSQTPGSHQQSEQSKQDIPLSNEKPESQPMDEEIKDPPPSLSSPVKMKNESNIDQDEQKEKQPEIQDQSQRESHASDNERLSTSSSKQEELMSQPQEEQKDLAERIKEVIKDKPEDSESEVKLITFKAKRKYGKKKVGRKKTTKNVPKKPIKKTKQIDKSKIKTKGTSEETKEKKKNAIIGVPYPKKTPKNQKISQAANTPIQAKDIQVQLPKPQSKVNVIETDIPRTRAQVIPKKQQSFQAKPALTRKQPLTRRGRYKSKGRQETQLTLKGQVANMTEDVLSISASKVKILEKEQQEQYRIEQGQQMLQRYMKKEQQPIQIKDSTLNISAKIKEEDIGGESEVEPLLQAQSQQMISLPPEPKATVINSMEEKRKKLAIQSRVVIESILYFQSKKEPQVVKIVKQKKPKHKILVVTSEQDEEPVQYVYKQKRRPIVEKSNRRYRKIYINEPEMEQSDDPYYYYPPYPQYRKIKKIRYQNEEDQQNFRKDKKRGKKSHHYIKYDEEPSDSKDNYQKEIQDPAQDETRQGELGFHRGKVDVKYSNKKIK